MKTETDHLHNNNIFNHADQELADYLKRKNLAYTNKKWTVPTPKRSFYSKYGKRLLDLTIAIPVFIILIPVYVIIAFGVLIDLGRPVFYKQTRVGRDGKIFDVIKFRSMNNKKDENGELLPPSQRVTRFGKFIRKYSLDELMEFWNIICGDMSIIGPRPLAVFFVDRMSERHKMRHAVRPGLECPRVVTLNYEYNSRYQLTFENDVWYVEHISFLQDVKMVFLLIKMVFSFKRRSAQATAEGIGYFSGYDENGLAVSMRTYKMPEKETSEE